MYYKLIPLCFLSNFDRFFLCSEVTIFIGRVETTAEEGENKRKKYNIYTYAGEGISRKTKTKTKQMVNAKEGKNRE